MMFYDFYGYIAISGIAAFLLCSIGGSFLTVYYNNRNGFDENSKIQIITTILTGALTIIVSVTVTLLLFSLSMSPTNNFSQADRINSKVFVKKIVEVSEIDSLSSNSKKIAYSADLDDFKDNGYIVLSGVKGDDSINLRVSLNEKTNTMIVKTSVTAESAETKTYEYTP